MMQHALYTPVVGYCFRLEGPIRTAISIFFVILWLLTGGAAFAAPLPFSQATPLANGEQRMAVEAAISQHGRYSIATQRTTMALATQLVQAKRYDSALVVLQELLDIEEHLPTSSSIDVASRMKDIAFVLEQLDRREEKVLYLERSLALTKVAKGETHFESAFLLNDLATTYFSLNRFHEALTPSQRAVEVMDRLNDPAKVQDHAQVLYNLGEVLRQLGNASDAIPPYRRALTLREKQLTAGHAAIAHSLNGLALALKESGSALEALPLYERAQQIHTAAFGSDNGNTTQVMINKGEAYQELGLRDEALNLFKQALEIRDRRGPPGDPSIAVALARLGNLYLNQFEDMAAATPLLERGLAILRPYGWKGNALLPRLLDDLAGCYVLLGQSDKSPALIVEEIELLKARWGEDSGAVAEAYSGLSTVQRDMGLRTEALVSAQACRRILEPQPGTNPRALATCQHNEGRLYAEAGDDNKALPLFEQALDSFKNQPSRAHELVRALTSVAGAHRRLGRLEQAQSELLDALAVLAAHDNLGMARWQALHEFSRIYSGMGQPEAAIVWEKEAVNTLQTMRRKVNALDSQWRDSFLKNKLEVYESLADLLIERGRVGEAQQVLQMLKEEELADNVRGSKKDLLEGNIILTGRELRRFQPYYNVREQQRQLQQERKQLLDTRSRSTLSPGEQQRLKQIDDQLLPRTEAAARLTLAAVEQDAVASKDDIAQSDSSSEISATQTRLIGAVNYLASVEPKARAVGIQYVFTPKRLSIIIAAPGVPPLARQLPVERTTVIRLVKEFGLMLKHPQSTPDRLQSKAQELYQLLLTPIQADLKAIKAKTLMLSPTDVLRYVPFAALHDGKRYVVQEYRVTLFNEAGSTTQFSSAPQRWRVAGMGLSQSVDGLPALSAVPHELDAVTASMRGERYLNTPFSHDRLVSSLSSDFNVLHVASHFVFEHGRGDLSRLYLGDKSHLTLDSISRENMRFDKFDLVTLSACNTALGGGVDASGQEVESLGAQIQRQKAQAVMATLWQVADTSTAELMRGFYKLRSQQHLDKAEALRQMQLAMLEGRLRSNNSSDWKAPYYWAPFVLMGNWR